MTEVKIEPYVLPGVEIGPENPLPMFRQPKHDFKPSVVEGVPEEETKFIGWDTDFRVLPYRLQDGYTSLKHTKSFDSIVMENEYLKAVFVPQLGGHMMSLVYKPSNTELLERNPVFQPRNLALRNAWISGGIEFNCGQLGHHYLTCSPIHACRITDINGEPGLRMYAWDRVKRFTYQMDFYLPSQSQFLFMHVRVVNRLDDQISMYWWTNIGAPQAEGRRVLAPADTCLYNSEKGFALGHLPIIDGYNVPYTTTIKHSMEFFFRIAKEQRKWEASVDKEGRGLVQTSTDRLVGRKLFVWGTSRGGDRWQEYLADKTSAYVEIQAGLAQTQSEHIPMPGNTEWTWTEAFGLLEMDPKDAHNPDWHQTWTTADAQLEKILPRKQVDALHEHYDKLMLQPCGEMLNIGLGWGALERLRAKTVGDKDIIPEQLRFEESDLGPDQQPWVELLKTGKLPENDPSQGPGQFMIQPEWIKLLKESIEKGDSDHWLGWYHLGVSQVEAFEDREAVKSFETSLKRKRTSWALRNLAAMELRERHHEAGRALYRDAWETGPQNVYLAKEYADLLLHMGLNQELVNLVESMPEDIRDNERIRLIYAWAKVRLDDYSEAERLMEYDFVSMAEGEGSLASLWFEMHERKLARELGKEVDDDIRNKVRSDFPPPQRIDFRVGRDVAER